MSNNKVTVHFMDTEEQLHMLMDEGYSRQAADDIINAQLAEEMARQDAERYISEMENSPA